MDGISNCYGSCYVAARPILQEYDASTMNELAKNPAEFGKLAARHKLVEIAEASRRESKYPQWMSKP